jgi:hypothetical protein
MPVEVVVVVIILVILLHLEEQVVAVQVVKPLVVVDLLVPLADVMKLHKLLQ